MTLYVADTNVVSELMRPAADARVLDTVASIVDAADDRLVITAVTRAELRFGLALLAGRSRRERLERALESFRAWEVLAFDAEAADVYGTIAARRRRAGLSVPVADLQIAATTHAHGATLLTRNVADVIETGIPVLDPWQQRGGSPSDEE